MTTTLKGADMLAHFAHWRAQAIKPNPTFEFGWHQAPAHFGFSKRNGVVTLMPRNRSYGALQPKVRLEIRDTTLEAAHSCGLIRVISDREYPSGGVAHLTLTDAASDRGHLRALAELCAFVAQAEGTSI